jgi:hypothetical protein
LSLDHSDITDLPSWVVDHVDELVTVCVGISVDTFGVGQQAVSEAKRPECDCRMHQT